VKWAAVTVSVALLGFLSVFAYSCMEDLRLGGMPSKELDISLTKKDRRPVFKELRTFASTHGFHLRENHDPNMYPNDYFDMSRWDAEIMIGTESTIGYRPDHLEDNPQHLSASIQYKGWLWWTDPKEADALSNALVSDIKSVDHDAKISVRTFPPLN